MRFVVGVLVLLLIVPSGVAIATPDVTTREQISGPAVPMPGQEEQNRVGNINDVANSYGGFQVTNAFWMMHKGTRYLVATNAEPEAGVATVTGTVFQPSEVEGVSYGLVFAESVSISQSGPTISAEEYNQSRGEYVGEVVHIQGGLRLVSSIHELPGVVEQQSFGRVGTGDAGVFPITFGPGQSARSLTTDVVADDNRTQFSISNLKTALLLNATDTIPGGYGKPHWWVKAPSTVTVLVVPEDLGYNVYNGGEFLIDVDVHSGERVSPATVQSQGESLKGEVVTVRGQAVGTQISTQETLLEVAKCAPESVTIPASPPLCSPLPYDVSIHSGAIATTAQPTAILPYAGLSSEHQQTPVTAERGAYELTGRVVAANQLDPRLDGYGLVVYERERIGDLDASGFAAELEERAENYTTIYRTQAAMSDSEYRELQAKQDETPTHSPSPTATKSPTETATATMTATGTPTHSPTTTESNTSWAEEMQIDGVNRLYNPWVLLQGIGNPAILEYVASNRVMALYLPPWVTMTLMLGGGVGFGLRRRETLGVGGDSHSRAVTYAFGMTVAALAVLVVAGFLKYPAGILAGVIGTAVAAAALAAVIVLE